MAWKFSVFDFMVLTEIGPKESTNNCLHLWKKLETSFLIDLIKDLSFHS